MTRLTLLAVLLIAATGLTACKKAGDDHAAPATTEAAPAPAPTEAAPAPAEPAPAPAPVE